MGPEEAGQRGPAAAQPGDLSSPGERKGRLVGKKQHKAEERRDAGGGEPGGCEAGDPAGETGSPGPLTVGRRSSAMREREGKSASPVQKWTLTGLRRHQRGQHR